MVEIKVQQDQGFERKIEREINDSGVGDWTVRSDAQWVFAEPPSACMRMQGWKLHVSADAGNGETVLLRCLPILLSAGSAFKCCATERVLAELNGSVSELSQIGKFLTVYPANDEAAVQLASDLHEATKDLTGPRIRSDTQYLANSLLHYRYGAFVRQTVRFASGARLPAIADPTGRLVPDQRGATPSWARNPFPEPKKNPDSAQEFPSRFLLLGKIASSPQASIVLAFDVEAVRKCVLKIARRGDGGGEHSDAYDRLVLEAEVLTRLQGEPGIPEVYEFLEVGDLAVIAMRDFERGTLAEWSRRKYVSGDFPSDRQVREIGSKLAIALRSVHSHGLVFRDLKPNNVVLDSEDTPSLIDFGLCAPVGEAAMNAGTLGFMATEQMAGEPPDPRDDIYSLGAVLYHVATGSDPSRVAKGARRCEIVLMVPSRDPRLADVIEKCLAVRREDRYRSTDELLAALADSGVPQRRIPQPVALDLASEVSDLASTIRASAVRGSRGVCWPSLDWGGPECPNLDINAGTAGTLLALADAFELCGDQRDLDLIHEAARALIVAPDDDRMATTGLFVGECGIGMALLRAGALLGDKPTIEAAVEIAERVRAQERYCEDLFCGEAGRIKFYLHLDRFLGGSTFADHARASADWILENALEDEGGIFWNIKTGLQGEQRAPLLGMAHGAAGVGEALIDVYEATGEERFKTAAIRAWTKLESQLSGGGFPAVVDGDVVAPFWCHGAGGIAKFVCRMARTKDVATSDELLHSLGLAIAGSGRWAGAVLCHGLSGSIDSLLDFHELTRDERWLDAAQDLSILLSHLKVKTPSGWAYLGDGREPFPDFMVGYGGVVSCFARLARPGARSALSLAPTLTKGVRN